MRNLQITRAVKINAQFTAEQWQLFASSMDCSAAVDALNMTLNDQVNSGQNRRAVESAMYKTMNQHSKYGATDSEPCWFLQDVLDRIYGEEE